MARYLATIHLDGGTKEQIEISRFEFSSSEETGEIVGYEMDSSNYSFIYFKPSSIIGIKIELLEADEPEESATD